MDQEDLQRLKANKHIRKSLKTAHDIVTDNRGSVYINPDRSRLRALEHTGVKFTVLKGPSWETPTN